MLKQKVVVLSSTNAEIDAEFFGHAASHGRWPPPTGRTRRRPGEGGCFRSWRLAVGCSSTYGHDAGDSEGPPTVLDLMKYILQNGSDPRL